MEEMVSREESVWEHEIFQDHLYPVWEQELVYCVSSTFSNKFRKWQDEIGYGLGDEEIAKLLEPPLLKSRICKKAPESFFLELETASKKYSPFLVEDLWSCFINLNPANDQEILDFVNKFGRIGNKYLQEAEFCFEPLGLVKEQIYAAKRLVEIALAFREGRFSDVITLDEEERPWVTFPDSSGMLRLKTSHDWTAGLPEGYESWRTFWEDVRRKDETEDFLGAFISKVIANHMDEYLSFVQPYFAYRKGRLWPAQKAKCLIGVIYYQIYQILVEHKNLRKCAAEGCGKYFITRREDRKYCSKDCGNRERVRRNYWMKKQSSDGANDKNGPPPSSGGSRGKGRRGR